MNNSETGNVSNFSSCNNRTEYYPVETLGNTIIQYGYPFVILLGTIGNFLALMVLRRRRMRSKSVTVYLEILAGADTGVLYFSALKTCIRVFTGFALLHVSDAVCKIVSFLFLFSIHMSAWMIVAISMDRFVAVWFPFKAMVLCNVRRAKITSTIIFLVLVVYTSHVLWKIQLHHAGCGTYLCGSSPDDFYMTKVYPSLKVVTYAVLPSIIVLILNICIISKTWCKFGQAEARIREARTLTSIQDEARMTTMLLAVSLTWLLLSAPFTLWPFFATGHRGTMEDRAKDILAKIICFLLLYLNHAINFYLYCVSGHNFRIELCNMVHGRPENYDRRTSVQSRSESLINDRRYSLVRPDNGHRLSLLMYKIEQNGRKPSLQTNLRGSLTSRESISSDRTVQKLLLSPKSGSTKLPNDV